MDNPISVSAAKLSGNTSLAGCIEALARTGYHVTDFWLCKYCTEPNPPMLRTDWRQWVSEASRLFQQAGITVGQAHAHWNHPYQIHEDFTYDLPLQVHYDCIEASNMLGCRRLIFHPVQHWYRMTQESEEMVNLNRTLTGINTVYELQLKSISQQIGTIDSINEQTRRMAAQIEELNGVYARMIKALTVNMKNAANPMAEE